MEIKNNKKGFTLVEVLIAMLITGIILSATYTLFVSVFKMNQEQNEFIQMQDTLRTVGQIVERDIRRSSQYIDLDNKEDAIHLVNLNKAGDVILDNEGNPVEVIYKLENRKLYRNGQHLMDQLDNFILREEGDVVYLELKSKTSKREVSHDKKIYLRKN